MILALALLVQDESVRRLGDPDPAVRDGAMEELRALGEAARTALVAGTRDDSPEVTERCRALLRWLDEDRDFQRLRDGATRLTLDVPADRPTPVGELLRRFEAHFGITIRGEVPAGATWHGALRDATALEVVDTVCAAIGLLADPTPEAIELTAGEPWAGPRVYAGPVRLIVRSIRAERETDFRDHTMRLVFRFEAAHERRAVDLGAEQIRIRRIVLPNGEAFAEEPGAPPSQQLASPSGGLLDRRVTTRPLPAADRITLLEGAVVFTVPRTHQEWAFDRPEAGATIRVLDQPATILRVESGASSEGWDYWTAAIRIDPSSDRGELQRTLEPVQVLLFDAEGNAPVAPPDAPPLVEVDLHSFPPLIRADLLVPAGFVPARVVLRAPRELAEVELPFELHDVEIP